MKKRLLTSLFLALASIFAFAQSQQADTNRTRIAGLLQEMHDAATWGLPTTNGIQLGVAIFNSNGVRQPRVFTYLYDETNFWIGLYPPSGYRLSLSLKNAEGKDVEKTKEGNNISKPVGVIIKNQIRMRPETRVQAGFDFLPQQVPDRYEAPFNLLDCFKVEKPGTNTLTVGAVIYKKINDGGIYGIALPPVSIRVPITQADLDNYRTAKGDAK